MSSLSTNKRIGVLDALRGIAALSVVIFHLTANYRSDSPNNLAFDSTFDFKHGHYGVELFFIISGFVIFMTTEKVKNLQDFAFRRFFRLYPIYWVCLSLTFTITTWYNLSGRVVGFVDYMANFTMIHRILGCKSVDGVYWSLFIELCFYGLIAALYFFNQLKNIYYIGFIWLILTVVNNAFHQLPLHTFLCFENGFSALFFAGILFYKMYKGDLSLKNHVGIIVCMLCTIGTQYFLPRSTSDMPFIIIIPFLLFYLFIYGKLDWLVNRVTLFLGQISYVLYLIHMNISYVIYAMIKGFTPINSPLFVLIPLTIVVFLSWGLTTFVEKPILQYFRNLDN